MREIFEKLRSLSHDSNQIILYNVDIKNTMKGIGRIIGKFDSELLELLKLTNGVSIFDYCFMGFKNTKLGYDIDKYMGDFWMSNNRLANHFLPFMITSTSDNFGYLMDVVDKEGRHPIGYYSNLGTERVYIVGSSFKSFMKTFLADVEETLNNNKGDFIINIDKPEWPINIDHWLANDYELKKLYDGEAIHEILRNSMPDTKFW